MRNGRRRTLERTQLQVVESLGMMSEEAPQDSPFTFFTFSIPSTAPGI